MKRLALCVALSFVAVAAAADDRPRVTGQVELPAGATAPAKFKVDVEILKLDKDSVIRLATRVGRHEISTAKSFPVDFAVPYPQTALKDGAAESFILRASVYEMPKSGGSKLVYKTPEDDRTRPFTAKLEPRQNLRLVVKPVK